MACSSRCYKAGLISGDVCPASSPVQQHRAIGQVPAQLSSLTHPPGPAPSLLQPAPSALQQHLAAAGGRGGVGHRLLHLLQGVARACRGARGVI